MVHSVLWGDSLCVVVPQHVVQKIDGLLCHQRLVLVVYELIPRLFWVLAQDIVVVGIQSDIVLFNVSEKVISSKDFRNFHQLVVIVFALEEWLLLEDHTSEHASQGPYIEGVIISLEIDQQLRSLEISGRNSDVVLLLRVVEFGKTPIYQSKSLVVVVDHDIMRLHISMHYTF